ncbi:Uncharacterized protein BP5553_01213 [Venustampulla echinocandica]|uniref:Alpha/beta hydrolase fold-3 domain-containing protein n=1 Tax=Venustampulla echinocandica TaxID=2656787 RepID=A0A370U0E6_9HELO|nr:Uncharacterized protein BP5553_01213 [Venustampulla echinocandica]RDL41234.1 Uncharacterized protein BP5553_01213 [Venustampulla echinocandica]
MASLESGSASYLSSLPPATTQIIYGLKLWSLKLLSSFGLASVRLFTTTPLPLRPSIIKEYPCRPGLANRIFVPRSHRPGELLPLYLDLHGGGFALLDAQYDDEFCAVLANKFNILVASIEYRKSPTSKFPEPTYDVVAISNAIIEDEALPIDKSRVVLGGFSAGGNLCLSAAQVPELKSKINGVIPWYPLTDFTLSPAEKQSSRPYRNAKDMDDFKDWGPIWEWAYVRPGQNLGDPLLSVRYATKDKLPKWVYMVGAEYDMLANEGRDLMVDLAGLTEVGKEKEFYGFEKDTYKWTLARGVRHGFTHDMMDNPGAEVVVVNQKRVKELVDDLGSWLFKGPFAA